jgi:isoleucyl-tRNA synthetase
MIRIRRKAYVTLYEVLTTFCRVLAPFLPFICEEIYQNLVRSVDKKAPQSVHLCSFPQAEPELIDTQVLKGMEFLQKVVTLGRSLSKQQKRKIRLPLKSLTVVVDSEALEAYVRQMSYLLSEALNVKEVRITSEESDLIQRSAKPNFKTLGKRFGKQMNTARDQIVAFTPKEIKTLLEGGSVTVLGEAITGEDIEWVRQEKEGLTVMTDQSVTIALDFQSTPALESEGNSNELVRCIQATRKDLDLEVLDQIEVFLHAPESLQKDFKSFQEYIFNETLTRGLFFDLKVTDPQKLPQGVWNWDINGTAVFAKVQKCNNT